MTNINTTNVTNVYNRTVVNNVNTTHVSFNGGAGGVMARPTAAEVTAAHERHLGSTPVQRQQQQLAERNSSLRATANGGRPAIAATPKAGVFSGHGVVASRGSGHAGGAPRTSEERAAPNASASRFARPPSEQHALVHESAPAHTPQPQRYASVQSSSRRPEHESRAETARPAPQYSARPEPQHQARPEPHYQSQPAPHHQPAAGPQGAGRAAGHEAERPEHGGGGEHAGEHNGHG